ncbi:hypothetical protein SELSPUOL_00947 [Selenomonas sputigena ATCC 35185]|uniref:Uncharacterized protein n=1 Tax=Selenomonas sputigena (strain ATCC 35185 / DSM 20758 / CCUG 44933 / VPI D19B-28) TaxID=546271 RepID=C9LUE0_SELS3|nr:hypothetical protein SELSPUOL_00947 [Selenomonas sputigena ATCC 35185]
MSAGEKRRPLLELLAYVIIENRMRQDIFSKCSAASCESRR